MAASSSVATRPRRRRFVRTFELISSMRFAISLLVLIAIASVIGTIIKQNESLPSYVNQFGPFWFEIFDKFSLYSLYSAWWFLLTLGFLVLSTSFCIVRNGPKMLKDMRSWRENVREQSLRNFHHRAEWTSTAPHSALVQQLTNVITAHAYQSKIVVKDNATLIAAKQGAANKWGYIFAHSAIVIICVGGLLDSDLSIRFYQWFGGKTPFVGNGIIAQIPQQYRLGLNNPSFRGNMMISEGSGSNTAIIPRQKGVLIQDLPFTVQLKKFVVDFYSTGMPKLFASEVVIKDHATGKTFPATIKVNQPLIYQGLAIYQSSFEDGGSKLRLTAYSMQGAQNKTFPMQAVIGNSAPLASSGDYTIEWSDFRPFNIENVAVGTNAANTNANSDQKFLANLDRRLGSAAKNADNKNLKNVGPNFQYKLRDKSGQAREFQTYMLPVQVDGAAVFLAGVREAPSDLFSYLRIPADDTGSVKEWMRLRAALMQPELRVLATRRYAERAILSTQPEALALRAQLQQSALRGLSIFVGDEKEAGYLAVSKFLQKIPAAEQGKAADIFMKILHGTFWELWQAAREKDGEKALALDEKHQHFLQLAVNALSDAFFYKAPIYLQLDEFEEVKASVFQVTRSPGKAVVYLGCALLILGVFSMFYIRERRLWLWVHEMDANVGSMVLMAMSSQRKTLDFEKEFELLSERLMQSTQDAGEHKPISIAS